MNKKLKVLREHSPTTTIAAAKKSLSTDLEFHGILSELIDNAILADKNKCVDVVVKMHCDNDDDKSFIEVTDNSIGIPEKDILNVFNFGTSSNSGKMLLSRMGMGLKGAVWALGDFDYLISKTSTGNTCQVRARPYDSDNEMLVYEQVECTNNTLDAYKQGTCVRVKRVTDVLPMWTSRKYFDAFVEKISSMYAILIYENRVNIKLIYTNSYKSLFEATCHGSFPLLSNPRHILNGNPEINIGHNEPTYIQGTTQKIERQEVKTAKTKVYITAGHKPTPGQVEKYFELTKDPTYDPKKYKNSVFGYGSENAGICVLYKGKLVQIGLEKASSREADKCIIMEVTDDSGLTFTSYKNAFKKDVNYKECLDAVNKFLDKNGFMIRSIAGTPQVSEKEIVLKFIDYLKNDAVYCDSFGIINFNQQVKLWPDCEVGEPDILIYDYHNPDKVTMVIEAKKDRCGGEEARQLWGYMSYYECNRGILLSGAKEQPSFVTQVNAFKKFNTNIDMKTANVKTLTSSKFFV